MQFSHLATSLHSLPRSSSTQGHLALKSPQAFQPLAPLPRTRPSRRSGQPTSHPPTPALNSSLRTLITEAHVKFISDTATLPGGAKVLEGGTSVGCWGRWCVWSAVVLRC
ncbi:hypothetical protein E2C01_097046 [Portunus trituberculatus]|uniref:Uncharacterized protein n=1 Tax=Portunus trituberculatus TaxID=210409 RepID=A0A5B7K4N0_PORTR|nr:hypothetical protein [Portunus trituberculatus]